MNLKKFINEFYSSQTNGVLSDYVLKHRAEVIETFGGSNDFLDYLIELSSLSKEVFDTHITKLLKDIAETSDLSTLVLSIEQPNESELLRQENVALRAKQELLEEALINLSDLILGGEE